jgi:hypothetical protein
MNEKNSRPRWPVLLGYLGVLSLLLACATLGLGSSGVKQGMLQLDQGIVKVQDPSGSWKPLAGTSTFEMVGKLENTNPWTVAGRSFVTNSSTQIAQGLKAGDLVRVRGAGLENNGTWMAYSIESAGEQPSQTVILTGKVTSVNPWVVNGVTLQVTNNTVINGGIQPGMLVRVEVLLQRDGTWEVISISPLGEIPSTSGCATVVATVESISGNQIRFLGWPAPIAINSPTSYGTDSGDTGVDLSTIKPGQQVLIVVCASGANQLVITKIIVIHNENDNNNNEGEGDQKVLICHKPGKKGGNTISVASSAVPAHLGHGDKLGPCP